MPGDQKVRPGPKAIAPSPLTPGRLNCEIALAALRAGRRRWLVAVVPPVCLGVLGGQRLGDVLVRHCSALKTNSSTIPPTAITAVPWPLPAPAPPTSP